MTPVLTPMRVVSSNARTSEGQSKPGPQSANQLTSFRWWIRGIVDPETLKTAIKTALRAHAGGSNHSTNTDGPLGKNGTGRAWEISLEEHICNSSEASELRDWLHALLNAESEEEFGASESPIASCTIVRMPGSEVLVFAAFPKMLLQNDTNLQLVKRITESYNALRELASDFRSNGSELRPDSNKLNHYQDGISLFLARSSNGNELKIGSIAVISSVTRGRLTTPQEYNPPRQDGLVSSPEESLRGNQTPIEKAVSGTVQLPATLSPEERIHRLTEIWEEVLNSRPIKESDDFFELGGHSLLAAKLLGKIGTAFRKDLSLASLLEAPTIEKQARMLAEMDRPTVVNEKRGDGRTGQASFILLGGDPTFQPMSKLLARSFDFYSFGLSSSVLKETSGPASLMTLAAYFVDKVLQRVPEGPYVLGGWCSQGLIALEVARKLQVAGREVSFVVLLQTSNPAELAVYPQWKRRISRNQLKWHLLQFEIAYAKYLGRKRGWSYLLGRIASQAKGFKTIIGDIPEIVDPETGNAFERKFQNVLDTAVNSYQPKRYEGRVMLVRGRNKTFGFASKADLGWGKLLPRLEVREVGGNHFTLYMPPYVEHLVKIIEKNWIDARDSTMRAKESTQGF